VKTNETLERQGDKKNVFKERNGYKKDGKTKERACAFHLQLQISYGKKIRSTVRDETVCRGAMAV